MSVVVEIVEDNIQAWIAACAIGRQHVVAAAAEDIAVGARSTVRVDTGALKGTIDAQPVTEFMGQTVWSVNAGNDADVDYAIGQEYGPGEHTPYMTPAAEAAWFRFQQAMIAMLMSISGGG